MTDDKSKKQLLLRLSPTLYQSVCRMAEDDFRSINGEIEYLLHLCAVQRGLLRKAEANCATDSAPSNDRPKAE